MNAGDSETEDCALAGSSQLVGMLSINSWGVPPGSTWKIIETCEFENPRAVERWPEILRLLEDQRIVERWGCLKPRNVRITC